MMDKARYGGEDPAPTGKGSSPRLRCLQRFFLMFRAHHIPLPESG